MIIYWPKPNFQYLLQFYIVIKQILDNCSFINTLDCVENILFFLFKLSNLTLFIVKQNLNHEMHKHIDEKTFFKPV